MDATAVTAGVLLCIRALPSHIETAFHIWIDVVLVLFEPRGDAPARRGVASS